MSEFRLKEEKMKRMNAASLLCMRPTVRCLHLGYKIGMQMVDYGTFHELFGLSIGLPII